MLNKKIGFVLLILFSVTSLSAKANSAEQHWVVAPQCLVKNLRVEYKTVSTTNNLLLIETNDQGIKQLIATKIHQKTPCGGFMDVTSAWKEFNKKKNLNQNDNKVFLLQYASPLTKHVSKESDYKIQYPEQVNQMMQRMNAQNMWANLSTLSEFKNRNARTSSGQKAAYWIQSQVEKLAKDNQRNDVTISLIETNNYPQPSVVAKVGNSTEAGIVVGAHMDTTSMFESRQPGADDDGSGSVTILETARNILSSGMQFKKPIYFVWYSAEEEGLIGSQHVVRDFITKQIPVAAVINFDMTGYAHSDDPTIWLMKDYVSTKLTAYVEELVNTYVKRPVTYTECGYACSDHATWTQKGFPAAMPFEASLGNDNPYIHSSRDTMENLSISHMIDYAKLALAFTIELAEPL